jgi:hypothetical protein
MILSSFSIDALTNYKRAKKSALSSSIKGLGHLFGSWGNSVKVPSIEWYINRGLAYCLLDKLSAKQWVLEIKTSYL